MSTLLVTHPACFQHDTGEYHPECAERLKVILEALDGEEFQSLRREAAPLASMEQILRAHAMGHVDFVRDNMPAAGSHGHLDPDTVVSEGSWEAALRSAGAVVFAGGEALSASAVAPERVASAHIILLWRRRRWR